MKSYKGNMLLIELVIVILFFSLSQLIIVQVFASSQQKAAESRVAHAAMMAAQEVAERLVGETAPGQALENMGFVHAGEVYALDRDDDFQLNVSLRALEQPAGTLHSATVSAMRDGVELLSLPSVYYEGAGQ